MTTATATATELEGLRRVGLLNTLGIHALLALNGEEEEAEEQSPAPAPAPAHAHVLRDTHKNNVLISKALQSFQAALALLQLQTGQAAIPCLTTAEAGGTGGVMELHVYPSSELFAPLDCHVNLHSSVVMYLYNRAIFFHPLADTSGVGRAFYAAILHFNLALAHHISKSTTTTTTTSTTSTTTTAIKATIHHYKQCLKVLRSIGVGGTRDKNRRPPLPGGGDAMMVLRLAALNNLAHSYYSFMVYNNKNNKNNNNHSAVSNNHIKKAEKTLQRTWRFLVAQRRTLFLSSGTMDPLSFTMMTQQERSMLQPPIPEQPPAQQYQTAQEQHSLEECPPSSSTTNNDRRGQEPTLPVRGISSSSATATASIMVLHSSDFVYQALINVMVIPTGTGRPPVMGASAA